MQKIHTLTTPFVRHPLIFSIALVSIIFIFTRLPFFLWFPIPGVHYDTLVYFEAALQMTKGILPRFDLMPPGYPLFIFAVSKFSTSLLSIAFIQSFLTFFSALVLIFSCHTYSNKTTLPASIAISIFLYSSFSIRYDTYMYTESIFATSIILFCSFLILSIKLNKLWTWLCASIFACCILLIRSNGMFILPVLFLIFFYMFKNNYSLKSYVGFALPLLLLTLIWSGYNYSTAGSYLPGNFNRITTIKKKMYTDQEEKRDTATKSHFNKTITKKMELLKENTLYISQDEPQFYYAFLPSRYDFIYIEKWPQKAEETVFNPQPISDELRLFAFKELLKVPGPDLNLDQLDIHNMRNNPYLFLYHIGYKIHQTLFRNIVWVLLFYAIFIGSLIKSIQSRFKDQLFAIVFLLCSINFLNIIVIAIGHGRFQARYVFVTEFTYYLVLALIIPQVYIFFKTTLINSRSNNRHV